MLALIRKNSPLRKRQGFLLFLPYRISPSIRGLRVLCRHDPAFSTKTRPESEHERLFRSIENGEAKRARRLLKRAMMNGSDHVKRELLTDCVVNMIHRGQTMLCVSILNEIAKAHRLLPSISALEILVERSDIKSAEMLVDLAAQCSQTTHSHVKSTILRKLLDWKFVDLGWVVYQSLGGLVGTPTPRQYSRLIKEFFDMSDRSLGIEYVQKLLADGFTPSTINYNIFLTHAHRRQQTSTVQELYGRMIAEGHSPSPYTYSILTNAFLNQNEVEKAESVIQLAMANGEREDVHVQTDSLKVLRQMKGPREVLRQAALIFDLSSLSLPLANFAPSSTSNRLLPLTAVSASLIVHQALKLIVSPKEIWALYCKFLEHFDLITPHLHTIFLGALASNPESNDLPLRILQHMIHSGSKPDEVTYGYYINQMAEHGRLEEAEAIWVSMLAQGVLPNVRIYTSLMKGYVKQKQYGIARQKFAEMLEFGLKPNVHTFAVISKCF